MWECGSGNVDTHQKPIKDAKNSGEKLVAVGMRIALHPPHRSVRALLTHTAPTLDVWRQTSLAEKGEECRDGATSDQRTDPDGPS